MLSEIDLRPFVPIPPSFNLAAYVLTAGLATPEKTALEILHPSGTLAWSYARLTAAIQGVATGLLALGLIPGDRILLRLGHCIEFPFAFLGAIAAGMVPVATSAALTNPEIIAMARRIAPALIVASPGVALPDHPCRVIADTTLRAMETLPPHPFHHCDANRAGYIVFTSGTSGIPSAVVHAHRAILGRRPMHDGWIGLRTTDRLLHAGAFNWTYTLGTGLLDPWTIGATALIPGASITADHLAPLMQRHHATLLAAVPGIYRQILRAPLPPLPHLRHALSAGEALPDATRSAWRTATGTDIHEALGMSELSTFVSSSPARPAPQGALGFVQPGRHIAVLGPDLTPVPRGTPGQLAANSGDPGLMLGYLDGPAETDARLHDGWFLTGDLVQMSKDGALSYAGRADDQLNAGGYRVSPLEVEAALATFPGLTDLAVVEHTTASGATILVCHYTSAAPLDTDALAAHADARLARYKQPRQYLHRATLPRGANGKLNRRILRQEGPP